MDNLNYIYWKNWNLVGKTKQNKTLHKETARVHGFPGTLYKTIEEKALC